MPGPGIRARRGRWRWPGLLLAAGLAVGLPMLLAWGLLSAALQTEPTVTAPQAVSQEDLARALSLLQTHDPRHARPGAVSSALVREGEAELLLGQAAQRGGKAAVRVTLERGRATVRLSSRAPSNPFGPWLNLELQFEETGSLPVLDRVRLGRLPLPAWLAERVALHLAERAGLGKELQVAAEVLRRVRFSPQQMLVTYAWQGDSTGRLFDGLLSAAELERLRPYAERLAALTAQQPGAETLPLSSLLGPLFQLARQRSVAAGPGATGASAATAVTGPAAAAAAENRAALLVLTLYANGRSVGTLASAARGWPQARPARLLMGGRDDFPLHFLVSAILASEGNTPLSRAVGLYKELADSRGGSGFSFNDMAANRSGTLFGDWAVNKPLQLQERVARGVTDAELLPRVDDLPEFMPEAEFIRRFGGVGAPAYAAMLAEIDRRIADLAVWR